MNIASKTKRLTFLGVIIALQMVMTFAHIGFIRLPFLNATILHIPVIIGAVLLGPIDGAILGLVFGLLSVTMATIEPNVTSFVFSPFYSLDGVSGNGFSLVVAIVPRVLIGITSYYTYKLISTRKNKKLRLLSYVAAGIVGSLTNTVFVMSFIYLFFGNTGAFAATMQQGISAVFWAIIAVVGTNGIPEAIASAIIVTAVCKVLSKVFISSLGTR